MNIALVGGSGFVGTRLLNLLKKTSHKLSNIDKNTSHFFSNITRIADVRDITALTTCLQGADIVILLAAEHRDDVSPTSLYYDVNVQGMRNVLEAMQANNVKRIVFTSSVAVYGLDKVNPDESHPIDPFNHYGKSKWQAECVLAEWYKDHSDWNINIIRPTVIFGERNRGNVYNLLKQISGGKFLMVGNGCNKKSMAYVGNIVAFIQFLIEQQLQGYNVFNYVDGPDFTMNQLVEHIEKVLHKDIPPMKLPYFLGMAGGYIFDTIAKVTGKKLPVSSVRIKKFCATTQFNASKAHTCGFVAPYSLGKGLERTLCYEFVDKQPDNITFITE